MRDFNITIENRSPKTFTADAGFVEEIGATRLVITLGGEMAENDIDYYLIDFELPSPLRRVKSCRIYPDSEESEAYMDNGVIYCTLWQELTKAPKLRFQLEAYRLDDNNEVKSVTRSGVVTLNLLHGISGEEGTSDTGVHGLLAEMQHIENRLLTLSETATDLYSRTNDMLSDIVEEVGDNIELYIGENGHWFFGDEDLGVQAQGETGATGATGAAGADGIDGINAYVHIRYGTSATPSSLLTEPNDYIGIYSGTSQSAPTTYSEYKWYKIKGEQGDPGNDGADGSDGADGADGRNLEFNWSGTSLGVRVEGDENYTYTDLKGDTGATGNDGQDGSDGADGVSPTITINTNTGSEYKLNITDRNGTIVTPNLKGLDGDGADGKHVSSAALVDGDLILTMNDDTTVEADLSDLVDGCVNENRKIVGVDLQDDITVSEFERALDAEYTAGIQFEYRTDHYRVKPGKSSGLIFIPSYTGTSTDIIIPKWYNDGTNGWALVTEIGTGAFMDTDIVSVKIPDSIPIINASSFRRCTSLTTVYFTRKVSRIVQLAFQQSNNLTDIYYDGTALDKENTTIDNGNDPLKNVTWHYNYAAPTKTSELTNDSNFVSDASYVHTDNNYTSAEKTKLSGIATGAEANVQSDWNETNSSSDSFIKNKPTIPTVPTNVSSFTNDRGYQTSSQVTSAISTATSDFVDMSTTQAITGSKTFTNSITVKNPTDEMGTVPSTDQETYITFTDKNGNQEGQFYFCHDTNDKTQFALILNGSQSGISCVFLEKGSGDWYYYPSSNNSMVFGHDTGGSVSTMDKQWKRIYGQTIYQNGKQVANKEEIPTSTLDITNDSGFTTKTYVDGLVGDIETLLQALR